MKCRDLLRHLEKHGCEKAAITPSTLIVARRSHLQFRDIARSLISSREKFAKTWTFPSRDIFLNRWEHSREGSGPVDDTEGHLQGEIRGPTRLVKMRGRDEMDGQPEWRECGMQSSQFEPMGMERDRRAGLTAE